MTIHDKRYFPLSLASRFMYRRVYFTGIVAYIIMLVLSQVFFKERTIFLDAAYNLFYIIKDGGFAITLFRFGDVFMQLPPVLARKACLPADTIFQIYSAGFVLFYFIAYLICGSILKRYDFALVILLLNILLVSDTFYWCLSQLPQAIAILVAILAFLQGRQANTIKPWQWCIAAAALATAVFLHPLVLFVILYCLAFFGLSSPPGADKKTLYILGISYCSIMLIKFLFFKTPYEHHSMSGLKNFVTQFPNYFTLFSDKRFAYNCLVKYYWIPVLFVAIAVFYVRIGAYKKLWLFACAFCAYLMLVNISYPSAATPEFYIENLYTPLVIFLALPFIFDLLPVLEPKKLVFPAFILILLSGCIRIYTSHTIYTARLNYERKILREYGDRKIMLTTKQADTDTLLMVWGTPYEFLLLSLSERGRPASIIVDNHPLERYWAANLHSSYVTNWNVFRYDDLPARYFNFADTTTGYLLR